MSDQLPPPPPPDDLPPTPPPIPNGPADSTPVASKGEFFKSPDLAYPPAGGSGERQWAIALHASAFAVFVFPFFGNILAPLILWVMKRPESAHLDAVGKEVLNFQISFAIYGVVSTIIAVVLSCLVVPIVLPFVVAIAWIVFMILAIVKTSDGVDYRYPATIRFIK